MAETRLSHGEKRDWLRLIRSEHVGPVTFFELMQRYGSAAAALEALPDLAARGGARRDLRICRQEDAEAELEAAAEAGLSVIARSEADYPPALRHAEGGPPLLFVAGSLSVLTRSMVAVVGSRNCSAAGRKMAQAIAAGLAEAGFVIASGLARGIDAAAHEAALETGTVAVMAGGVNVIYPPEHDGLHAALQKTGAAVSEMPLGTQPRGKDFPRRNRIIAGMALGTVVVEAAARSGSLITGRIAGEQGRDVFAVPGSPLDPRAEGTNRLLKDGAILTRSAQDVIDALTPFSRYREPPDGMAEPGSGDGDAGWGEIGAPARAAVLEALGPTPVHVDDVVRHTGLPAGTVQVILLELEMAGKLERQRGSRVALI